MRRIIGIGLALIAAVIIVSRIINSASAELRSEGVPDFAGTWRLAAIQLMPVVHYRGHVHATTAPPPVPRLALRVTQHPDSVTVQVQRLDSADHAVGSADQLTYRASGEWSGRRDSVPGQVVRTRIHARPRVRALELETVATVKQPDGTAATTITTTETWQLSPDGALSRRVHDESAEGVVDRVERWIRIQSRL